jgi:hypothetical protein
MFRFNIFRRDMYLFRYFSSPRISSMEFHHVHLLTRSVTSLSDILIDRGNVFLRGTRVDKLIRLLSI